MVETLILSSYPVKVTSVCPVFMQASKNVCVCGQTLLLWYIRLCCRELSNIKQIMVCYEECYRAFVDRLNDLMLQCLCQQPSPRLSHNMRCRKYKDFLSILPQAGILIVAHDHLTNIIHIIVGMTGTIMNALSSPAIAG